ncbi:MAG: flagellar protein FlaG [Bacteroidetes bacterium]|nr:flagellar protein FlaG [Bacteroidota bacterium]
MATKIAHIAPADHPATVTPATDEVSSRNRKTREENRRTRELAAELNKMMESSNTKLTFVVDEQLKKAIIKVVDAETNKVIRQIPSEDSLRVAKKVSRLMGILYDDAM